MKKLLFFIILLIITTKGFSQDFTCSFPLALTKKMISYSYVDNENDNSYSFVGNKNKVKAIHYDNDFKVIDSLTIPRPDINYENIAGVNKNEAFLNLFWAAEKNNDIYQQAINFKERKTSFKIHKLNFDNQKIIQTFSSNDKLFILSIYENSSLLSFHIIDNKGILSEEKIDLSKTNFYTSNQQISNLYDVLRESIQPSEAAFELPVINLNSPTSLSMTSKKRKCYYNDNKLIITIDSNKTMTQVIQLDLTTFKNDCKFIYSGVSSSDEEELKSNSLIVDNTILQVYASTENFTFTISDFNGTLIKNYTSTKDEKLEFPTSDFITEEVNPSNGKKPKNTEGFLNSISYLGVGISSYKIGENNLITIGGVSRHKRKVDQESLSFLSQYGLIGTAIYLVFYNQDQINYDFSRDFCYVNSLMDKNYVKKDEKVISYPLELMKNFFNFNPNATLPTLITTKKAHYLGYYNANSKSFSFLKYDK